MAELSHFSLLAVMAPIVIALGLAFDDPQSELVGEGCSPNKYVSATTFTDNLDSVLQSLLSNLSSGHGFATSMENKYGKTDPVYGLAVCRKYLSAQPCAECFTGTTRQAAKLVKEYCSEPNGVRIHLDGYFLRYENNSFFYQDLDAGNYNYCSFTKANDPPYIFPDRVKALSAQLVMSAVANNGYAVASIGPLYGLAQCWPSLITSSCQECLDTAHNNVIFCGLQVEGRGLEAGCFMRYSTYLFFPDNQTSCTRFSSFMQMFDVSS